MFVLGKSTTGGYSLHTSESGFTSCATMQHMPKQITAPYQSATVHSLASAKWLALSLICLFLLVFSGCSYSGPYAPPPASVKKPPIYPNAQQPQVTPTVLYPDIPSEAITFSTTEKSDSVLDYYENVLTKEGWTLSNPRREGRIRFVWNRGCPLYYLDVLTKSESGGQTQVELKPAVSLCL